MFFLAHFLRKFYIGPVLYMGNLKTVQHRSFLYQCRTVFRILIICFLRAQYFFKDIAKQLVNRVETGPIKEKSTNSIFHDSLF